MQRGGASVPRRRRRCRRCLIGVGVVIGRCNTGLLVLDRRDLGARCIGRTVAIWLVAIWLVTVGPVVARTVFIRVVGVGDGAAVAAGCAPAVAVGGVAVVQERLGPLDEGGDAEL